MAPEKRSLVSCEQMTEKLILNSVLDIFNLMPFLTVVTYSFLQAFYVAFKQHTLENCCNFSVCVFSSFAESRARFYFRLLIIPVGRTCAVVSAANYGPRGPWFETWPLGRRSFTWP